MIESVNSREGAIGAADLDHLRSMIADAGGLMSRSDIARLLAVSRQRVGVIANGGRHNFPEPAAETVSGERWWFATEVLAWLPTWTGAGAAGGAGLHREDCECPSCAARRARAVA